MPKSKKYVSDSESGSDSDTPKSKKQKKEKAKPSSSSQNSGEVRFQLAKMRFVSVSEFRGKKYVNIREYYDADGDLKPGKKGIALAEDQWEKLKSHIDDIDSALKD